MRPFYHESFVLGDHNASHQRRVLALHQQLCCRFAPKSASGMARKACRWRYAPPLGCFCSPFSAPHWVCLLLFKCAQTNVAILIKVTKRALNQSWQICMWLISLISATQGGGTPPDFVRKTNLCIFLIGKGILIEGIILEMEIKVQPLIKWSFKTWRWRFPFFWPLASSFSFWGKFVLSFAPNPPISLSSREFRAFRVFTVTFMDELSQQLTGSQALASRLSAEMTLYGWRDRQRNMIHHGFT